MIQAFTQQFFDTASFYTVTTSTTDGVQTKSETLLYDSIPCNLVERSKPFDLVNSPAQDEQFTNEWRCDVSSDYGGAARGDTVKITKDGDTREFVIKKKVVDTDFNGTIQFYKYFIEEKL